MKHPRRIIIQAAACGVLAISPAFGATSSMKRALLRRVPTEVLRQATGVQQTLAVDHGKFKDVVNGKKEGEEAFDIAKNGEEWVARGTADISADNGPATRITSLLRLRSDGTPIHYEWSTQGARNASSSIDFDNGTATIVLRFPDKKPFTQQFFFKTSRVAILDDNLYYEYAALADLYDWSKGGPQDISVLVPQEMTPGSVTMDALGPESIGGKDLERLRVHSQDLDLTLYFDQGRLERISIPSSNAEIERD